MGTISEYLVPVRVRTEYAENESTGEEERICYLECKNGEILTVNVPFEWANFISRRLNQRYVEKLSSRYGVSDPVAVMRIDGEPLKGIDSQIVGKRENGELYIMENPKYIKSMQASKEKGEDIFLERWIQLPIDCPIMISCIYNVKSGTTFNIAKSNVWILDLLENLGIITSSQEKVVKSMDGSRFRKVKDEECTIIVIRKILQR